MPPMCYEYILYDPQVPYFLRSIFHLLLRAAPIGYEIASYPKLDAVRTGEPCYGNVGTEFLRLLA